MYVIKPEVQKLSEEEILKALSHKDEDNLIVQELTKLLKELVAELSGSPDQHAAMQKILDKPPSCPLEKVAFGMVADIVGATAPGEAVP